MFGACVFGSEECVCLSFIIYGSVVLITDQAFSMAGAASELDEPLIALLGTYD